MFAYETIAARNARLPHANGFGAMRHLLALGIVIFHGFVLATGDAGVMPVAARALADPILPGFFAISGFLVAGSLAHSASLAEFMALRLLRIMPALIVVVLATALLLGPLLTTLSVREYFSRSDVSL